MAGRVRIVVGTTTATYPTSVPSRAKGPSLRARGSGWLKQYWLPIGTISLLLLLFTLCLGSGSSVLKPAGAALHGTWGRLDAYVSGGSSSSSSSSSSPVRSAATAAQTSPEAHLTTAPVTAAAQPAAAAAAAAAAAPAAVTLQNSSPLKVWQRPTSCDNSCYKARDGVCDEGRGELPAGALPPPALSPLVLCDLGSDCADCGAWAGAVRSDSWQQINADGPVDFLRQRDIPLHVRASVTLPSFQVAFTNPKVDQDASQSLADLGVLEGGITRMFLEALTGRCVPPVGSVAPPALVLDVGANMGYFSLLAASFGCRVVAWEPVPKFRAFMEYAVALNRMEGLIELRTKAVSDVPGTPLTMSVPRVGSWGTARIASIGTWDGTGNDDVVVETEAIHDVITSDVLLLKVDIEGWEPQALRSADRLVQAGRIETIIVEYNAGSMEDSKDPVVMASSANMLLSILAAGYRAGYMPDNFAKAGPLPKDLPLQRFQEVTAEVLAFDVAAAGKLAARTLGCPVPPALTKVNPAQWHGCNTMPEDTDPRSFRSMFMYNANVLCSRNASLLLLGPPVGLCAPQQDLRRSWTSMRDPGRGMGGRVCQFVPPDTLVRNRCPCTNAAVCGEEERMVMELLLSGNLYVH